MADMLGIDRRINKNNPNYQKLKMGNIPNIDNIGQAVEVKDVRLAMMIGLYEQGWSKKDSFPKVDMNTPNWWRYKAILGELKDKEGNKSQFNHERYSYLLAAPFNVSAKCCYVMKKTPAHEYSKNTKRKPITGQTASESRLRTSQWLRNGCNGFDMKTPISNPMSFWTEQDILLYIKINNIPIASVYGDIVYDNSKNDNFDTQLTFSDMGINTGIFDKERPLLKTTGCHRTGCMFCGFGCHLEKEGEGRFERMKETHPAQYNYIMKPVEEGGLGYKEIIDWLNEHGNLHIRY